MFTGIIKKLYQKDEFASTTPKGLIINTLLRSADPLPSSLSVL